MAQEIERKFLISGDDYKELAIPEYYRQGFLSINAESVVRVRTAGKNAWITVKSKTKGISRSEYEYEIPVDDANEMLNNLCQKPIIEKHRYKVPIDDFIWEVDEFHAENEGLIIAEIELKSETDEFEIPIWIGREVTGIAEYYNANLIKNPYCNWKAKGLF